MMPGWWSSFAEPQARSRVRGVQSRGGEQEGEGAGSDRSDRLPVPARQSLKFSAPRDPATVAAFINLRVLNPEHAHWRRGVEAAVIYHRLHGGLTRRHAVRATAPAPVSRPGQTASNRVRPVRPCPPRVDSRQPSAVFRLCSPSKR
ncbi:hypothetical protein SGLAM104S_07567 [Streptomyces glaucescens]|jgi:hypothetical protein